MTQSCAAPRRPSTRPSSVAERPRPHLDYLAPGASSGACHRRRRPGETRTRPSAGDKRRPAPGNVPSTTAPALYETLRLTRGI